MQSFADRSKFLKNANNPPPVATTGRRPMDSTTFNKAVNASRTPLIASRL